MRVAKFLLAFSTLILPAIGWSAEGATYVVNAELRHQGSMLAAPTMTVTENQPATMELSGENGYRLEVTLAPSPDGDDGLAVDARVFTAHGELVQTLTVSPGVPAEAAEGDLKLGLTVQAHEN